MSGASRIIAAGPVIVEQGKVLLVKHGDDPFWKFPGGKWEETDFDLEGTARREAREELGIEVILRQPLRTLVVRSRGGVAFLIHFAAERRGEVRPGPHIREWGWFPTDDLPKDAAPNVAPLVADHLRSQNRT